VLIMISLGCTPSLQALKDLPTPFSSSSIRVTVVHVIGSEANDKCVIPSEAHGRVEESMGQWTGTRARQRLVADGQNGWLGGGWPSATRWWG
jgi:hypothetical protein